MFTSKATVYFSFAVSLLILALVLDDLEIGILVLGLASLFFLSNVWGLSEKVGLQLDRKVIPSETFGGENITVELKINNLTRAVLQNLEFREILDGGILPEKGASIGMVSIGPLQSFHFAFDFPCPPRANYVIGPLIVTVRDPFGFYLVESKLTPDTLSVVPRPEPLVGITIRPRHVGPWPGVIPSRALGVGTEFYSMRDYVSGDDPKRINWKASARHNSLIVNETEAERVTDVMVVLDTDVTLHGPMENLLFEQGVHAAASMTRLLLRQGNRVGLVLQGVERGSIPAGFGKRHERRILYMLAAAKPGRASVSTSYVMNLLARRMIPSRAQVVLISPLLDAEIREGVRQLSKAGYSLLVISPSPAYSSPRSESEGIAYKIIMLERSVTLLELERSATVVDWPPGVPLQVRMTKVKRLRPIVST